MSADTVFREITEHLFVLICNLKRDIVIARRDLSGVQGGEELLNSAEECWTKMNAGMVRVNTLGVDEISELIFVGTSALIDLRKWMHINYLATVS